MAALKRRTEQDCAKLLQHRNGAARQCVSDRHNLIERDAGWLIQISIGLEADANSTLGCTAGNDREVLLAD